MAFMTNPALIEFANKLVLKQPNLNVLKSEHEGRYPPLTVSLEMQIKKCAARGRLMLPDLSAYGNQSIAVFSDYSGEGPGNYHIYSFLVCAWNALELFHREMKKIRADGRMGDKEIEFKDFGMAKIRNALPSYLQALDKYVPGLLFTVVIDKRVLSVFGPSDKATQKFVAQTLEANGFGRRSPANSEKLVRIVHTAAFLAGLLGHQGQKVFWMSDHDAICANPQMHMQSLRLFQQVLDIYSKHPFTLIGGALPFEQRSTEYLDLLSAADVTAGSIGHFLTRRDAAGPMDVSVKPGADQILLWLGHDSIALKKFGVVLRRDDDGVLNWSTMGFLPYEIPANAAFVPIHI